MNFWERLGAYIVQRLTEPTTYSGLIIVLTGLGIKVAPELWDSISTIGLTLAGMLLAVSREGANTTTNPSLPAVVKGEAPPAKPDIVQPPAGDSP